MSPLPPSASMACSGTALLLVITEYMCIQELPISNLGRIMLLIMLAVSITGVTTTRSSLHSRLDMNLPKKTQIEVISLWLLSCFLCTNWIKRKRRKSVINNQTIK
jgi:hypothetical protein